MSKDNLISALFNNQGSWVTLWASSQSLKLLSHKDFTLKELTTKSDLVHEQSRWELENVENREMDNYLDFERHGYQVKRELGQNRASGRVTYLAKTQEGVPVVIKQFQFAKSGTNWSDFEAVEREIQLLQQLNHFSIPRYLDSFETSTGFCLVQEYKEAPPLAELSYLTPQEVKQIAIALLEVLVYLQKPNPPIIHRDIKPENILVDRSGGLKVYLVDFGFARLGSKDLAASSVIKGTLGFMPPEQIFNRQLQEASDLYSLGITLICLLTRTNSTDVGNLIDENYQVNFKSLLPKLNPRFVDWLEKMTARNLKNRYPNAAVALKALKPIEVVSKVKLKNFRARTIGAAIGLAALGSFVLLAARAIQMKMTPANISTSEQLQTERSAVRKLLKTGACPGCALRNVYLGNTDLAGVNLEGANLEGVNLSGAKLINANLKKANLKKALLNRANLGGANLEEAIMGTDKYLDTGIYMMEVNLVDANLQGAYLENANLQGANLKGANLANANLQQASLMKTNLRGTNLQGAKLGRNNSSIRGKRAASLGGANLIGVNLEGADLRGVYLVDAKLTEVNLKNANLENANFRNAKLQAVNLKGAKGVNLKDAQLDSVTMPDGTQATSN